MPGDEFDFIRQFDKDIIRPGGETVAFVPASSLVERITIEYSSHWIERKTDNLRPPVNVRHHKILCKLRSEESICLIDCLGCVPNRWCSTISGYSASCVAPKHRRGPDHPLRAR